MVRDVSVVCGKQVRIETEGKDTELDRTLLKAINDPLNHLVRNAVDHGIESPEKRVAGGKPAAGLLTLRALHEGGHVTIEISDDGAGIDAERIRKKAVERGIVTADQAARMSAGEALNLIFMPGVSTADKVTNVSGRGVGMDVVRTNFERVGGSVEIQTRPKEGTTFIIKVPLTLAIVPALIVRSARKSFAIPQVNLVELVRLEKEQRESGIEMVHGAPVYRLRGRLLPLVRLNDQLKLNSTAHGDTTSKQDLNIVVLQVDGRQFGLVVDEVSDAEEIFVKPLSKHLKGIKAYAGATIMGDGKLALILDVLGLAQCAGITAEGHDSRQTDAEPHAPVVSGNKEEFVLFTGPENARMALPLSTLDRLEEFPASRIERSGESWVVQYRGQILPLLRMAAVLGTGSPDNPALASERRVQVLVLNDGGYLFGLVVDQILDIVEAATDVRSPGTRAGIRYTAVIDDRVTELVDVPAIRLAGESQSLLPRSAAAGME